MMQDIVAIADVPVIFLSDYARDEVIAQAMDAGADDYMVKPFSPTELGPESGLPCAGVRPRRCQYPISGRAWR